MNGPQTPRPGRRRSFVPFVWSLALAAIVLLAAAPAVFACPNCAEAVASQTGSASGQSQGYFWSILAMVSMPFLLTGAGIGFLVLSYRRAARLAERP